ncbi:MAG: protease complex subunit PrcB family protein [Bryobacteraceae bacterium]|nr:protease complex subunit PrcB family protein [Bryobacteraceae bacterium]
MEGVPFEVVKQRPTQRSVEPCYEAVREGEAWIVTIHAGRKPTGGYSVEVRRVEKQGSRCMVHYAVIGPPPDAMVPQVITYPAVTVRFRAGCGEVAVSPPLPRGPAAEDR